MKEIWLPIKGSPGYWISDRGRAKSASRILQPWWVSNDRNRRGHLVVSLGRSRRAKVSHLVLENFIGPRPPGKIALHEDDNPTNNRPLNLRWGTYTENMHDSVRNGRHASTRKDRCPKDHPLDGVYYYADGTFKQRYCKTCKSDQKQARKQRTQANQCQMDGCENPKTPGQANRYCDDCRAKARERRQTLNRERAREYYRKKKQRE